MFQKKATRVNEIPAGLPGMLAEANITTSVGCVTISDAANKVKPGDFIIAEIDNNSKRVKYAKLCKGNIANKPVLGVVLHASQKNPHTQQLPEYTNNSQVMYLTRGSVYIQATADATAGHFVHVKNSDGSLAFDAAASKNEHTFTGFRVSKGGKANTLVSITSV